MSTTKHTDPEVGSNNDEKDAESTPISALNPQESFTAEERYQTIDMASAKEESGGGGSGRKRNQKKKAVKEEVVPAPEVSGEDEVRKRVNADIERRVQAEMSKRLAEQEAAAKILKEKEMQEAAENEDRLKERVAAETEARLQAEMEKKLEAELQLRLSKLEKGKKSPRKKAVKKIVEEEEEDSSSDDSDSSDSTSDDSSSESDQETNLVCKESFVLAKLEPVMTQHKNGIFGDEVELEGETSTPKKHALEDYEDLVDPTGTSALGSVNRALHLAQFETTREPGRCLRPCKNELPEVPRNTHVGVVLGFFEAKQTIISRQKMDSTENQIAKRDPELQDGQTRLCDKEFFYEQDMSHEAAHVEATDLLEDELPCNHPSEKLISEEDLANRHISEEVQKKFVCSDPLQSWERTRGRILEVPKAEGAIPAGTVYSTLHGLSFRKLWVGDMDPKVPIPAQSMFNAGSLFRFDLTKMGSGLQGVHGVDIDPLFGTCAIFSVKHEQTLKISETFHFASDTDAFFPHKVPFETQNLKSFMTFVPNEHLSAPLYMIIRVFRLAHEDFDSYVDLYHRAVKYKQQHVVPMKQETLQLAMTSDITEELGWYAVKLVDGGKMFSGEGVIDKLLRNPKPVSDEALSEFILSTPKRNSLKALDFHLSFKVENVTSHEISFPRHGEQPIPIEAESVVSLRDPNKMNAQKETIRYTGCSLPILNAGFFHAYQNVAYLRLQGMKLTGAASNVIPKAYQSFVLKIALKDDDTTMEEEGLPAIYGRALSGSIVERSAFSSTTHGCREVEFSDEFKIQLPALLTEKHHIFLTLFGVVFKKPQDPNQSRLVRIGHAAVPIMNNSALQVRDSFEVSMMEASSGNVKTVLPGYLAKMASLPTKAFIPNAVKFSLSAKSSLYVTNTHMAQVLNRIPVLLREVVKNDNVFAENDVPTKTLKSKPSDSELTEILFLITQLPLPEVVAFFPMLMSLLVATVASPSMTVSMKTRSVGFRTLIETISRVQTYEVPVAKRAASRGNKMGPTTISALRTSSTTFFYHFLSNDVLFTGNRGVNFKVFAAFVEVMCSEIQDASTKTSQAASPSKDRATGQLYLQRIGDLSWLLLDVILRSVYLHSVQNAATPRKKRFHPSFFAKINELLDCMTESIVPLIGLVMVNRIALFVRLLALVCDRGQVLHLARLHLRRLSSKEKQSGSIMTSVRILMDGDDAVVLCAPSPKVATPSFFCSVFLDALCPLLVSGNRETRTGSANLIYNFCTRAANSSRVAGDELAYLAVQMLEYVEFLSGKWHSLHVTIEEEVRTLEKNNHENVEGRHQAERAAALEKRTLLMIVLWIIFYVPESYRRRWMKRLGETNAKVLAGLIALITEAQHTFRFSIVEKTDLKQPAERKDQLKRYDCENANCVSMIGCRVAFQIYEDFPQVLKTIKSEKQSPVNMKFLQLLEALLSLSNSTAVLQISTALLQMFMVEMLPELISKKAGTVDGLFILMFRVLSSSCIFVRHLVRRALEQITQRYYVLTGSLSRLKSVLASALVDVAESPSRDLRHTAAYIHAEFQAITMEARVSPRLELPTEYCARYTDDSSAVSGNVGVVLPRVPQNPLSVERKINVSKYLIEARSNSERPTYATEFSLMATTMMSLYEDVLRLKVDDSMKFKDARCSAYYTICENFLRQNTVKETFVWLRRLIDLHSKNGDAQEAGTTLIFMAALAFRITEMFFHIKGRDSKGSRMPYAVLSHVFWHDYVNLLPDINNLVTEDTVFNIAVDLNVIPDDKVFSIDGQIQVLHEACIALNKTQYYELALLTGGVMNKFIMSIGDFGESSRAHLAMQGWATAVQQAKRTNHKYYLLWARMEREIEPVKKNLKKKKTPGSEEDASEDEGTASVKRLQYPIKRVLKLSSSYDLNSFKVYAKQFVGSLLGTDEEVEIVESLEDTKPFVAPTDTNVKKSKKSRRTAPISNRCLVTTMEIMPFLSYEQAGTQGQILAKTGKLVDRSWFLDKFQTSVLAGAKPVKEEPVRSAAVMSTNIPRTSLNILEQRLEIHTFHLKRSFPGLTVGIDVEKTTTEVLSAEATALDIIETEAEKLALVTKSERLISALIQTLTPQGMTPPGTYYKTVVKEFSDSIKLMDAVRRLVELAKEKLDSCDANDAASKYPEKYAVTLKAIADIECAVIDSSTPVESSTTSV